LLILFALKKLSEATLEKAVPVRPKIVVVATENVLFISYRNLEPDKAARSVDADNSNTEVPPLLLPRTHCF
jgi:hypothetical protein